MTGKTSPIPAVVRRLFPLLVMSLLATGAMLAGFLLGSRPLPPPVRRLDVTVVNVGNGEASWIRTPRDRFILIGGGPPGAGPKVADALRAAGARHIDLLVLPYPYAEAIGGVPDVLRHFEVRAALETGYPRPDQAVNQVQEEVRALLAARSVPVQIARAGQKLALDGVRLEVLAPAEPLPSAAPGAANSSLVLRAAFGNTVFLFAGGLERAGETALIARGPDLRAGWLRVARFGTRNATSPEFLRLVRPSVAVISVARGNFDGYPHRETLERLAASGARVFRTDEADGDLSFWSDGFQVGTL